MIGAEFNCNICGARNTFRVESNWRETPSCSGCGANIRFRHVVHCLLLRLLGRAATLSDVGELDLVGVGLTDATIYSAALSKVCSRYTNTYYHQEPLLDICRPAAKWSRCADFLISSDVFEHVPPPAQSAFDGAAAVLKKGGLLVLTVPFGPGETVEHYPDLQDFRIVELGGEWVLVNRAGDGQLSARRDLVFHGGPGTTLEMRVFGLESILRHLANAGFTAVRVHATAFPPAGIFLENPCSVPITAIAP